MNPNEIIENVQKRYGPLPEECIAELVSEFNFKAIGKHDVLVREGQFSKKVFLIIQGAARAYYYSNDKDVSDWFAFSGEFICPIVSFFSDKPSAHYIEVLQDSMVAELSYDSVERLAAKYHDFEKLLRLIVTEVMLRQQKRISSILFYTAKEKYDQLIQEYPLILDQVPLKHIASHLGMTMETLSRVRKNPNLT